MFFSTERHFSLIRSIESAFAGLTIAATIGGLIFCFQWCGVPIPVNVTLDEFVPIAAGIFLSVLVYTVANMAEWLGFPPNYLEHNVINNVTNSFSQFINSHPKEIRLIILIYIMWIPYSIMLMVTQIISGINFFNILSLYFHLYLIGLVYKFRKELTGFFNVKLIDHFWGVFYIMLFIIFSYGGFYAQSYLGLASISFIIEPISIVNAVLLSSITEELAFRGFIQDKLGIIRTSIIFSIMHIPAIIFSNAFLTANSTILYMVFDYSRIFDVPLISFISRLLTIFVFSMLLGDAKKETNSILYPILCHMVINFVSFSIYVMPK